ncbi:MAG: hypothetical protein HONDAALG_03902 [Gammaproteobacteria bacterium]|nr:hypothetical protein [Gammaproteobacteria bacterium]
MEAALNAERIGDELNRTVKLAMDTGEAATPEEARDIFRRYRLCLIIGADVASSPSKQAALLTAVNTGRRCFLGGVEVFGCSDAQLLIPWRNCRTIAEAVTDLQGSLTYSIEELIPRIIIGDVEGIEGRSEFAVRATFDGWRGGVVPMDDGRRLNERNEFTPAGVLAGALAVSEAFQHVRGHNAQAGRRAVGLSLWQPNAAVSWLDDCEIGPRPDLLPARLWLIGLGHLGQAYLWTLGFLPYERPSDFQLILQDYDALVAANDSTSLLTDRRLVGQMKTRAMAGWCEGRGFRTRINERRFAPNFRIDEEEPQVALCGVDNELARAALEDVGFSQIIEAGLGRGTEEYLAFQIHCFPANRSTRQRWGGGASAQAQSSLLNHPAYLSLASGGMDQCGLTMLADRAVGASFVGAFTSTLVVAELLRMAMGERRYEVIDGTLRSPENLKVFASGTLEGLFNPGVTTPHQNVPKLACVVT